MGFYSMPRYFQAMPQVGKPLRAQKQENIQKILTIEEDIHRIAAEAIANGKPDDKVHASGEWTAMDRLAVYLGTEDSGLREDTVRRCDDVVKIPMARGIDSLNVAACAAVAFWALRPSQGGLASPLRDPPADFPFAPSVLPDGKSAR